MFLFELLNLAHGFGKYFDGAPAVTPQLQTQAYEIRHRVYCEELGFEPVRPDRCDRGQRLPSVMTVTETEANLPRSMRPLHGLLCNATGAGLEARPRTLH